MAADLKIYAEAVDGVPTEEGWYIGRHKSQGHVIDKTVFKVTRVDSSTLLAWQPGDERSWPVDRIDFYDRIWL